MGCCFDHCNDLNLLIDIMTSGGNQRKGMLITNKETVDSILSPFHKTSLADLHIVSAGNEKKLDKFRIKIVPTKNREASIGFKIITSKFTLGYTGDTGYYADMAKHYSDCDILIVNNTFPFNKKQKDSMNSDTTVALLSKIKPSLVILQHFGPAMLDVNPLYEARMIQKKTGVQVIAARDGLLIEPASYAAEAKQKNLMGFRSGKQ